ncbi:Lsr2 family protein [Gordonia sp. OPL2]|uniref:histone-like nucleoid-structuring protein Lsr2 n=1 Tax=Gordonia sp. OPL2 TaxID=2486274 RepID=UPI001655A997|nr:Lsr2 family protein [Gordonia sp. OPL2]ROZ86539.1 Lsr2 family protein [Gordonia sp. OPL2]
MGRAFAVVKVERVEIIDDVDGKVIDPDDLNRVEIEVKLPGRKAARYRLDLRTTNVARLEKDLAKYIRNADQVRTSGGAGTNAAPAPNSVKQAHNRAVREWARENGYDVSSRGRLPVDVIEAFDNAH